MTKYMVLALAWVVAQDRKQNEDEKETSLWNGSVSVERADAFPQGSSKQNVRFGLIDDAEAWKHCWKRIGGVEPKVDFKKDTVLFVCYEKWPGELKVGGPVVEDGVMTIEVALDGQELKRGQSESGKEPTGMRYVSPKCHYDYSCRALARADLRKIKIIRDEKDFGEIALAKAK